MSGNVEEWVGDWWQYDYYAVSPASDPQGPAAGIDRVLRGGSHLSAEVQLRVSSESEMHLRAGTAAAVFAAPSPGDPWIPQVGQFNASS